MLEDTLVSSSRGKVQIGAIAGQIEVNSVRRFNADGTGTLRANPLHLNVVFCERNFQVLRFFVNQVANCILGIGVIRAHNSLGLESVFKLVIRKEHRNDLRPQIDACDDYENREHEF